VKVPESSQFFFEGLVQGDIATLCLGFLPCEIGFRLSHHLLGQVPFLVGQISLLQRIQIEIVELLELKMRRRRRKVFESLVGIFLIQDEFIGAPVFNNESRSSVIFNAISVLLSLTFIFGQQYIIRILGTHFLGLQERRTPKQKRAGAFLRFFLYG
jgi:hypothetical protein